MTKFAIRNNDTFLEMKARKYNVGLHRFFLNAHRPSPGRISGRWIHWAILLAVFPGTGCARSDSGPKLYPVSGIVTVDGQPIDRGTIAFDPADRMTGSYGGEINDGKFSFRSSMGEKKVSIMASRPTNTLGAYGLPEQVQYLPARYNYRTELTVLVKEGGQDNIAFELHTK